MSFSNNHRQITFLSYSDALNISSMFELQQVILIMFSTLNVCDWLIRYLCLTSS